MKVVLKRVLVSVLGFALLAIGLVFSIPGVPGPGLLIVLIGLLVLASEFHWARRLIENLRRRFPRVAAHLESGAHRAQVWMHRRFGTAHPGD